MSWNLLTCKAGPLGLLEEDPHGSSLNVMLQGLTRFFLDKIVHDYKSINPASTAMEQVSLAFSCEYGLPSNLS